MSFKWQWHDDNLEHVSVGNPNQIIQNLEKGYYKPYVSEKAKTYAAKMMNIDKKFSYDSAVILDNDPEFEDDVVETSKFLSANDVNEGDIPVVDFCQVTLSKVETELQFIAQKIVSCWEKRIGNCSLTNSMVNAFNDDFQWYNDEDNDFQNEQLIANMNTILDNINCQNKDRFILKDCIPGYKQFVAFVRDIKRNEQSSYLTISLERIYAKFRDLHQNSNFDSFMDLFEYLQIKTYSEAFCETVGSIMVRGRSSGRNLHPKYLSNEVYLRINLPPLHVLKLKFIPEIVKSLIEEDKIFYRKCGNDRWKYKLISEEVSATVHNFRKKEDRKSKVPIDFFA